MEEIVDWDLRVLHKINELATAELNWFFEHITHMADFKFMTVLLVILLACHRARKMGIQILIAELLQLAIGGYFLKQLIARPRPFQVDSTISLIIQAPQSFSCPSGHTSTAFALAFAIIFSDSPRILGKLTLALAILIGFSRLYLQVHFPTDVMLGAVLGCVCGYTSKIIRNKYI